MKKKTRFLSVLLSLLMLLSIFVTCIAAETAAGDASGTVATDTANAKTLFAQLGWKRDTKGYTGTTELFAITDAFGSAGNKALYITEFDSNWCGVEIVSAEKMAGVTKYSISADMMYEDAATFAFRFGDPSNNGDCLGISWNETLWNALTSLNDKGEANYKGDKIGTGKTFTLKADVNVEEGTVVVYINGEKVSERADATKVAGPVYMMLRGLRGYLDNVVVKNEVTGAVIYSEDFEGYSLGYRPVKDYTGKKAGEVVFSDNYDDAAAVEDLNYYYQKDSNGKSDFGKASWSVSNKINGTNCARITGNWAQAEIIPAEAVTPYRQYTIHMTLMFESNSNRFTVVYNSKTHANNQNSGFFDMRYNPVQIESLARKNGGNVTSETVKTAIGLNQVFDLALSVDCDTATMVAYINGERVSSVSGMYAEPSAVYIVAQSAVGYVDNVMITAGSYEDYVARKVAMRGVQTSAVTDNKLAIRFVGSLGDNVALKDYTEVGFAIQATYGAENATWNFDGTCTTVYDKLLGTTAAGITEEYAATDWGAKYLYALSIVDVPADITVTFTVTPYYKTADGATIKGFAKTVTVQNGAVVTK